MKKRKWPFWVIWFGLVPLIGFALIVGIGTTSVRIRQQMFDSKIYAALAYISNEIRPYLHIGNSGNCIKNLKSLDIEFVPVPDTRFGSCLVEHAGIVSRIGNITLSAKAVMTCSLAKSLTEWERIIQQQAIEILGTRVDKIGHLGTYNCRSLRSIPKILSEHAYANGIDIKYLQLSTGDKISIQRDWNKNSKKAKFLHAAANSACGIFSLALTPNSNASHSNHFHFDNGISLFGTTC
jgi:hypothetical protein